jgi:hypothetical protein
LIFKVKGQGVKFLGEGICYALPLFFWQSIGNVFIFIALFNIKDYMLLFVSGSVEVLEWEEEEEVLRVYCR